MVTAFGREEIMRQAEKVGLQGFLIKPVSPSMMYDTIMEAFGKSSGIINHDRAKEEKPFGFEHIRGAKLLLVEDNEINQQVAKETLEQEGFYVDVAEDGKICVERLQADNSYDLVLMDLQMPVMDGYEATIVIRKDDRFKDLPIVAMTAEAMTGVMGQVEEVGMNDYVTKPIVPGKLWKALTKWIKPGDRKLPDGFAIQKKSILQDSFPIIEGIDTEAGLNRVASNHKLYKNLLKKFIENYSDVTGRIAELKEQERVEEAVREAHTVKGVSANLGAEVLQKQMAEIELKLKEGGYLKDSLALADEMIGKLVRAIEKSGVTAEEVLEESEKISITTEEMTAKLQLANESLSKRKPKPAIELLDELEKYDVPLSTREQINKISALLEKYKMKEAMKTLDSLLDYLDKTEAD